MCIHLKPLENYLQTQGIAETYRGQVWSKNCREWIYYDAVLNPQKLKEKFQFDDTIKIHDYEDIKVGSAQYAMTLLWVRIQIHLTQKIKK